MNTKQMMLDIGLNPFGAELLCESLLRSQLADRFAEPNKPMVIQFPINRSDCPGWAGVEITLRPIKEGSNV